MPREVRNIPASILGRLRNVAVERGSDFQVILSHYVLERLLYRLSISPYRNRFILKGALLFPLWLAEAFRPTRDLDLLGSGDPRPEELARVFGEVMNIDLPEDGVAFDVGQVQAQAIRDAAAYDGVRVRQGPAWAGRAFPSRSTLASATSSCRGRTRPSIPYSLTHRRPDSWSTRKRRSWRRSLKPSLPLAPITAA